MLSLGDVLPLHLADLTFPANHPLRGQQGVVMAFAIRHSEGIVLFDTGIGRGSRRLDEGYAICHRRIEDELAVYGIGVEDVVAVVNSHLHFDHCGANSLFPEMPIHVQATEYAAAHEAGYTHLPWVDFEGAR